LYLGLRNDGFWQAMNNRANIKDPPVVLVWLGQSTHPNWKGESWSRQHLVVAGYVVLNPHASCNG